MNQCVPVDKDSITGADLAAANPAFSPMQPTRTIGYSPAPGRQRLFTVLELKAIAESAGLAISPTHDVCFEWRTAAVSADAAELAMKQAYPEASIDILEMSRYPAPEGEVVFPERAFNGFPPLSCCGEAT